MTTPTVTTATVSEAKSSVQITSTAAGADLAIGGAEASHLRVAVQPTSPPPIQNPTPEQLGQQFIAAMKRSIADQKTAVDLAATAMDARVLVSDGQGFEAHIGNANLETARTGGTSRTSAASLLLFGSDKRVLWRAPQ